MPRTKTATPQLERRSANGKWFFRRFIQKKVVVIKTGTKDKKEAETFREKYMRLEIEAQNRKERGELAVKTAQAILITVRGEGLERYTFEEGYKIFLNTTENFRDHSSRYQQEFLGVCQKFFAWCATRGIFYMDEISNEIARNYAKFLWDSNLSAKSFDDYVNVLSKLFATVDAMKKLPNRNPFCSINISRKRRGRISEATHRPLEPDMINAVMKAAAEEGEDWYDLFLIGLHTGMRLKDAALLQWNSVNRDFIEVIPFKTRKFGTLAKVPISDILRGMFEKRRTKQNESPYVNPAIANFYLSSDWVKKKSQKIFVKALGKENTIMPKGEHRKINVSIYSFESFRTTFTSLLGSFNTEFRVIMELLGWTSWNMLRIYEKKYKYNSDFRDKEKIQSVGRLTVLSSSTKDIVPTEKRIIPTKESLERLILKYSNVAISKIFEISNVAVAHWLARFGLVRPKRLLTPDISDEEIQKIREGLRIAA